MVRMTKIKYFFQHNIAACLKMDVLVKQQKYSNAGQKKPH